MEKTQTLTPEQVKQIKRINQRLAQMEKTDYKETGIYNELLTRIEKSGIALTKSRSGETRISRKPEHKQQYGMFTLQQQLDYIEHAPKLADELRRAKRRGDDYFPLGETPRERVIKKFDFSARLESHLQDMYQDAYAGNMYGAELRNLAKSGKLRGNTYEELEKLMNEIDDTREKLIAENVSPVASYFEEVEQYDYRGQQRRTIPDNWGTVHKKNRT